MPRLLGDCLAGAINQGDPVWGILSFLGLLEIPIWHVLNVGASSKGQEWGNLGVIQQCVVDIFQADPECCAVYRFGVGAKAVLIGTPDREGPGYSRKVINRNPSKYIPNAQVI